MNKLSAAVVGMLLLLMGAAQAQQDLQVGIAYSLDFGSLGAGAFTNNSTVTGLYLSAGSVTADDGSGTGAGPYVYSTGGEGALGAAGSGVQMGIRLKNNGSSTIECMRVTYRGEQWRMGQSGGTAGSIDFSYATGATVTALGGGTGVGGLGFTAPQVDPTCGAGGAALDGNNGANSSTVTALITGLTIAPGEEIMLQWAINAGGCSPNGLAVDDISVEAYSTEQDPVTSTPTSFSTCSFVADWTQVPGATSYLLDVSTDPAFGSFVASYNSLDVGNTVSYVVSSLAANTTYYFRVRAVTPCGNTDYSNTSSVTTLAFLATPTSTAPSNILCNSFQANWNALAGSSSYRIDVSSNAGFTAILPAYNNTVVVGTSLNVTGLTAGTQYWYRVRAVSDCGTTPNSASQTATTVAPAVAPGALAATGANACSFNANWNAVATATSYTLDVSTNNTFTAILPAYNALNVGNVTTYQVTGLTASTTYYYRLRAVNACGPTAVSGTITVGTTAAMPAPVTTTGVTAITCTGLTANWATVAGAQGYYLELATDAGFGSLVAGYDPMTINNPATVTQAITGLSMGTTYYYRVRAFNNCGASINSTVRSGTTHNIPVAPNAAAPTVPSCTGFRANWTAPSPAPTSAVTGYELDVTTDAGYTSHIAGSPFTLGNVTNYTLAGLSMGTTYYYRVRAINACGTSASGTGQSFTTYNIPVAPVANTATPVGCTGFTALWTAPSPAPTSAVTAYTLQVATDAAFTSQIAGSPFAPGVVTSRAITGLANGTTYYYRVAATNACGTSSFSNTITVTTLPAPVVPTLDAPTNITTCSMTLNWLPEATATTGYNVQVSTVNTFASFISATYNGTVNVTGTSVNVTGLTPGTTYYWRVRTVNTCGSSGFAAFATTPTLTTPAAPTVTLSNAACNTFDVSWPAVANATGYRIDVSTVNTFASFVGSYNNLDLGNVTGTTISGLNPGTTYFVRMRAYSGACPTLSAYSTTTSISTLAMPGTVTATAATLPACTGFTANWNALAGLTGYYLDVSTVNTFASFVYQNVDVGLVTSYAVTGLNPSTTYYYRLRGYNACGTTLYSNTIAAATLALPNNVTATAATNLLCNSFQANWTLVVAGNLPTNYRLDVSTNNTFTAILPAYSNIDVGNVNNYSVTGLNPGTPYYYRVKAENACGVSVAYSGTITATTQGLLAAPTAIAATTVTRCSFLARWNAVAGTVLRYELDVSTDPAFGSFVGTYNDLNVGTVTSYSVTGLTAGTTYYYRLRAVNDCGESATGNTITQATTAPLAAPGGRSTTNIGCNQFTANWAAVTGVTGYRLDVSTDPAFGSFVAGYQDLNVGNVLTRTVTGLTMGTTYYWRLRSADACGAYADSPNETATTRTNPPAPTLNAHNNLSCIGFRINWQAVTLATEYRVDIATDAAFTSFVANNVQVLAPTVLYNTPGLTPNTTYYYRVRAVDACGTSVNSTEVSVTTPDRLPAPTGLTVTLPTCNSLRLNWTASTGNTGALSYRVDVSTDPAFGTFVVNGATVTAPTVLYNATGLTVETTYYFRVRAVDNCGQSANSVVVSGSTVPRLPAPNIQAIDNITCNSLRVNWQTVVGATNGYRVDVSTDPAFGTFVVNNVTVAGQATALYNVTGLVASTTYYARVRAVDACGNPSLSSTVETATTLPVLNPPTIQPATNILCNAFRANWDAVTGATGYRVDVSTDPAFGTFVVNNATVTAPTIFRDVTGLTPATTYYYRVRAVNACGTSANSTVQSVLTDDRPNKTITNGTTNITNCSFTANWLPTQYATTYRVEVSTTNTFAALAASVASTGNVLTWTTPNSLLPNTTYYWRVLASNACGTYSVWSDTVTMTTLPNPTAPTATSATVIMCNGFTANWTAVTDAQGYFLDVSTSPTFASFIAGYNNRNVGNVTTFNVTGLVANTVYYFRVRAYINVNCTPSPNSNTINVTTDPIQPAPTATAATNLQCNQFTANWTTIAGATGYYLDVSTVNTFASFIPGFNGLDVGNVLSYDVTGLNLNTTYYYRLRAYNPACVSANTGTITAVTLNVPNQPNLISITPIDCDNFTINFAAAGTGTPTTSFVVDVSTNNTFTAILPAWNNVDIGATSPYVITGLNGGTLYYVRIRAVNACGVSINSTVRSATTIVGTVNAPGNAAASLITPCSFRANWTASATAGVSYYLDVATDNTFTSFLPGYQDRNMGTALLADLTGLNPSTQYFYRVRAVNPCNTSVFNTTQSPTTQAIPTPTGLSSDNVTACGFRMLWTAATGSTGYQLEVSDDPAFGTFVLQQLALPTTPVNYTITGLTPGVTYYWRVRSIHACGISANVGANRATLANVPTPTANAATNITPCAFRANWAAPATGSGYTYRLDVATDNAFTSFVSGYQDRDMGTALLADLTGLNPSTQYFYRVRAVHACGTSPNSGTQSPTTLAIPTPTLPATSSDNVTACGFRMIWNAATGTTGYQLEVSDDPAFGTFVLQQLALPTTPLNYTIAGLTPGVTYYWRVRSIHACGISANVGANRATLANVPIPTANAATTITPCAFRANWAAPATGSGYTYRLDVATDAAFTSFVAGYQDRDMGTALFADLTGLNQSTQYFYRVRAVHACGTSPNSGTQSPTTLAVPTPTLLAADNLLTCSMRINWNGATGSTGYLVDVATDAGFTSLVINGASVPTAANPVRYTATGLSSGTTYYYRVRSLHACDTSVNVSGNAATAAGVPVPLVGTVAANSAATPLCNSFTANWGAATLATGYTLQVSTNSSFTALVPGYTNLILGTVLTYNVTGLALNTQYWYRVRAFNGCDTSTYSNSSNTTTRNLPSRPMFSSNSAVTSCSFRANWTASTSWTTWTYTFDLSTASDFSTSVAGYPVAGLTSASAFRDLTGLTAGTTYYWRVRAVNTCGSTEWSDTASVVVYPIPTAPTATAATGTGCTAFTANWNAVANATNYFLDISTDPAFGSFIAGYNNVSLGNVLTRAVTGLTPNTYYYYRVRARIGAACAATYDSPSSNVITTNTTLYPNKVDALDATAAGCTSFTANWTASAGSTGYRLDVSTSSVFTSFVTGFNNLSTGNVTTYSVTGLTPGTTYYYRVRPSNACGTSTVNSDTITVNMISLPSAAVSASASGVGCTSFTANWDPSSNADGYYLDVATNAGFTVFVTGYNNRDMGNVTSATLTGLTMGTTYYYRVRAYRAGAGCVTANSGTQTLVLNTTPAVPTGLSTSNVYTCQMQANWNASATATGYYLDVATTNTFTAGTYVTGFQNRDVSNVTNFTITGLNPSTTYYWRIRAYNACGNSANTGTITQATPSSATLLPPTALNATFVLSCRFNAEWQAIPGVTTYYLDVATTNTFTAGTFVSGYENYNAGTNTTVPVSGLSPSTTYYYRLRGQNTCGISTYSNIITVATTATITTPASTSMTDVTCSSFTANWSAVTNAESYRLDVSTNIGFTTMLSGYNNLNVGTATSWPISGLAANTSYYFRIRAVNQCGATASTSPMLMTTDAAGDVVASPQTNVTCTQFTANWTAVPGALHYLLDVASDASFATILGSYNNFNTGNVTSITVTGVAPGNTYYYRLRAVKPCGTSQNESNVITVDMTGGTHGLWTGAASDWDWHNCMNWDNMVVPTYGDVVIPPGPTSTPQNVPTVTLNSLTMNNGLGIRMVGNVTLTSYLKLVSGIINTQANRVIVTNNSVTGSVIDGGNSPVDYTDVSSYVAGTLERAVVPGARYYWPIGTLTLTQYYALDLAAVNGGLTSIAGTYYASVPVTFDVSEHFTELGMLFNTMITNGYWRVNPNAGAADFDMELYPNMGLSVANAYTFVKKHTPGDPWSRDLSSPVLYSGLWLSPQTSLKRTGFTAFSDVAVVTGDLPLPIEGLQLSGVLLNPTDGQLHWNTSQEEGTATFDLEHTYNGVQQTVSSQTAAGYSTSARTYSYLHRGLQPGSHYYRVKATDLDGDVTYSNTVVLAVAAGADVWTVKAWPNPVLSEVNLQLQGVEDKALNMTLTNHLGQQVRSWQMTPDAYQWTTLLNMRGIAKGVYHLTITGAGQPQTIRLVVLEE